ncbi:MAG: hypothetical protein U9P71_02800 [Campylobacterota bacterium]|nr:hypothetical protein [Campylobacterota bacterium]
MLKPFYTASVLLVFALLVIVIHAFSFNESGHNSQLRELTKLSNLHVISLSTSEYEPRMRIYEHASNLSYPELLAVDTMSYVYE